MYATIRRYRIKGPIEPALHRVEHGFVPELRKIPGLVSFTIMVAGETWAAISVFKDYESALESNRVGALWAEHHLQDTLISPPQITSGEVMLHIAHEETVAL